MNVVEVFEKFDAHPPVWLEFVRDHKKRKVMLEIEPTEVAYEAALKLRTGLSSPEISNEEYAEWRFYEGAELDELWACRDIDAFLKMREMKGWLEQKKALRKALKLWDDLEVAGRPSPASRTLRNIVEGNEPMFREVVEELPMGKLRKEYLSALRGRKAGRSDSKYNNTARSMLEGWLAHGYALMKDGWKVAEAVSKEVGSGVTKPQVVDAMKRYGLKFWSV